MSSTKTLKVAIIGTGLQGQGLAALCNATGAVSNYSIVLGSRNPSVDRYRGVAVPVVEIDTALHGAQIVILAIPPINFPEFMEKHSLMLPNNAVIVDMSNPTGGEAAAIVESGSFCSGSSRVKSDPDASIPSCSVTIDAGEISNDGELIRPPIQLSVAEWLQSHAHDRFVVKAFTNIRFQMHTDAINFHGALHTVAASDSRQALDIFQRFASACGIVVRIVPALAFARSVERYQRQPAFAAWRQPFAVFAILFLLHYIYCAAKTRNFPFGNGVQNVNSALAWSALTGLSLTVLPGRIILPALKLVTGNHVLVLPRWIKIWMQARREIGLLATFAATLHVLLTVIILNSTYCDYLFEPEPSEVLNWRGNATVLSGMAALAFLTLPTIASLPSVAASLTRNSWQLVFPVIVPLAFVLGTAHAIVLGIEIWPLQHWHSVLPPVSLASTALPMLVILSAVVVGIINRMHACWQRKGHAIMAWKGHHYRHVEPV